MAKFGSKWFHKDVAFCLRALGEMGGQPTVLQYGGETYTVDGRSVIRHDGQKIPRNFKFRGHTADGKLAPPAPPSSYLTKWRVP